MCTSQERVQLTTRIHLIGLLRLLSVVYLVPMAVFGGIEDAWGKYYNKVSHISVRSIQFFINKLYRSVSSILSREAS